MKKRIVLWILVLLLIVALCPVSAFADNGPYTLRTEIEGKDPQLIRAYDALYAGNIYLSLTDLAAALNGTEKQFRFERIVSSTDGEYFAVTRAQAAALSSGASEERPYSGTDVLNPYRNRILFDGNEHKSYTHHHGNGDLYMSLTDVQLMLDLTAELPDSGRLVLQLDRPFLPDISQLKEDGYFEMMNSVYLGDAATGKSLFYYDSRETMPVASISKLLSYVVLREALDSGEIRETDTVRISENVQRLSFSADGIIRMLAGQAIPFRELLEGMLISSSNECALALAEHLCGSEEAFVQRMNTKAQELGLRSAEMFNCHGLPSYSEGNVPVKHQNRMSASDLFKLTCLILERYPDITEITSRQYLKMPSLDNYQSANSNPLLFNMEGVTGMKTGSTNRAGYCLVATMPVQAEDGEHVIVLVILGAESADVRGQAAEILLRYAADRLSQTD